MARSVTGSGVVRRAAVPAPIPRTGRRILALLLLPLLLVPLLVTSGGPRPARAQDTTAASVPDLRLRAGMLLGGKVRPGDWAAARVHLENDGPAVNGELRIRQGDATYGLPVELATGARQEHVLHGQASVFGGRLTVELVQGNEIIASQALAVDPIEIGQLGIFLVAERSAQLLPDIRGAGLTLNGQSPRVTAVEPEDLPEHVEAWSVVDRLVWQDVPVSRLTTKQLDALATWIATGGDLVILGGSTGVGVLEGFPDELLPYRPESVVDVPTSDLEGVLDALPAGAAPVPALAGMLVKGTALAVSGDQTVAARMRHGQGSVTILGFDPTVGWLSGTDTADTLWSRMLRPGMVGAAGMESQDDSFLVSALSYLPSVTLPPMDQLFLLFIAYLVLLGPVTYLVLRRLDRREWAWVVMPALAITFTAASYLLGVALRGSTVVVNELAVVRGGTGTDRGVADAYVGVFSPTRTTFDISLPGALVSQSNRDQWDDGGLPFDVLVGDPARLRDFQVGFGSLRGFRARSAVATPRVETALRIVENRLQGLVTNASDVPLEDVALLYGDGVQVLGDLAAGQDRAVDVGASGAGRRLVRQLFADADPADAAEARSVATRMAIVRQLSGEFDWGEGATRTLTAEGPVLLAWRPGGVLEMNLGIDADRVGDTLYVLPVQGEVSGDVTFEGGAIGHTVLGSQAIEMWEGGGGFYVDRGTLVVDYHPGGFDGRFSPTALALALASSDATTPGANPEPIAPLPDEQQPDQADPMATGTGPRPASGIPAVQLFDRVAGRWVELEPMSWSRSYAVAEPERYVDGSGGLLVRFVVRSSAERSFGLGVRLAGTVE